MKNTTLASFFDEQTSDEAFQELEEQNALGAGGVVGYTGPLGSSSVGTDKKKERGFWRNKAGKKTKTSSPSVHNPKALALQSESFGAMHRPDFKGPAMPGLWKGLEDPEEPVKTGSPELDKDLRESEEAVFYGCSQS